VIHLTVYQNQKAFQFLEELVCIFTQFGW